MIRTGCILDKFPFEGQVEIVIVKVMELIQKKLL